MSITAKQLDTAVRQWESDNEDHELLQEYGTFWDILVEESLHLPGGIGEVQKVANGTFLELGDKVEFVIVKVGDQFFRITGWYDSWGGESGWDGPLKEVEEVEVVTKEWQEKK